MLASRDFMNKYEKFYDAIRQYLWPYDVLEELAEVEVDIYSAFIDRPKLQQDFAKLRKSIKDVLEEDDYFRKTTKELEDLVNDEDLDSYHTLVQVGEVNPEKPKALKLENESKEDEDELGGYAQ